MAETLYPRPYRSGAEEEEVGERRCVGYRRQLYTGCSRVGIPTGRCKAVVL